MVIIFAIFLGLYVTYPVKRLVKYLIGKLDMPEKTIAVVTFITSSLLFTIATILIYGYTAQCFYMLTGCIIALSHWLFLDIESLRENSKIITNLNKKSFRLLFGGVLSVSIFLLTMSWFFWLEPYYITPLLITFLYMLFIYRKPKKKTVQKQTISP